MTVAENGRKKNRIEGKIDDGYIRYLKEQTEEMKKLNESASVIINILKRIEGRLKDD